MGRFNKSGGFNVPYGNYKSLNINIRTLILTYMASIDKTHVTWEQYNKIKKFFTPEMINKQICDIGYHFNYAQWEYTDFHKAPGNILPLWNPTNIVDIWLAVNCKLDFIQDSLKEQYPKNWIGWEDINFNEKGYIICIENVDGIMSYVSPICILSPTTDSTITPLTDLIVYGTTHFIKSFYDTIDVIRGEYNGIHNETEHTLRVKFKLFGLYINAKFDTNGAKYFLADPASSEEMYNKEISYCKFHSTLMDCEYDPFLKLFNSYNIKHSYNKNDYKKYTPSQIIMSEEGSFISVDMYLYFSYEHIDRYFLLLPTYIQKLLK